MTTSDSLQDFQDLLRDLFQFDAANLDFGVYRILNEKRDDIERFIEEDLVEGVREELEVYKAGKMEEMREDLEAKKSEIRAALGEDALRPDGSIGEDYENTPLAQEYRELQEDLEAVSLSVETERRIYDDLARFFNRYYDSGDFLTKRRFAAGESKYYLPYDGEEVMLHWANRNQYYVKTTEYFRDYRFSVRDVDVHFDLVDARTPQDNVQSGDTRHFILQGCNPVEVDADAKACTVQFAYRPITESENEQLLDRYNKDKSKSNQRETNDRSTIVAATTEQILDAIDDATVRASLGQSEKDMEKSPLHRHLNRYMNKHTADYFVHKDLGSFLRGQLEFFIQNEVLQLGDVLEASEQRRIHQVDRAKVVKKIGERIIDFLTQIENFQKRLFEKKKFVMDTGYCVTLDRVPDSLYDDILDNSDQFEEWRDLYSVEEWKNGLFSQGYENGAFTREFLETHPHVMIDTRHFGQEFEDQLLSHLSDTSGGNISESVDGICIQSENLQAMNILSEMYSGSVDVVYADPPYNTVEGTFLYKNDYKHSSWISMIQDRAKAAKNLIKKDGVFGIAIDDTETHYLRCSVEEVFGKSNFVTTIAAEANPAGQNLKPGVPARSHDYFHVYAKSSNVREVNKRPIKGDDDGRFTHEDEKGKYYWDNLRRRGGNSRPSDRPNQWYPLYVNMEENRVSVDSFKGGKEVWPIDGKGIKRIWRVKKGTAKEEIEEGEISVKEISGEPRVVKKTYASGKKPKTLWESPKYSATTHGTKLVNNILPDNSFSYPKSLYLVEDCIKDWCNKGSIVLDPFSGSGTTGHACMKIGDEYDIDKYILIDMEEYLDKSIERLKKVAFTDDWDSGVPQGMNGQSHIIQYHRLESYEDALNNIKVEKPDTELDLMDRFDDYALHYMLPTETNESETLLAPEAFEEPFDYTLRIQHGMESPVSREVDLESTFNYLIGLEVETRHVYEHQNRRYVIVTGQVEREQSIEKLMVVWRNRCNLDLSEEKEWAADTLPEGPFDTVYVNGPSHIHGKAEPTEIVFRERMDPAAG